MSKDLKRNETKASKKSRYVAPKLSCFGEVRHLTTGGSGKATEGTNDMTTDKSPMT